MATVSPLPTWMSIAFTAWTLPRRVANSTVRFLMSRSGWAVMPASSIAPLRIDEIAHAVAEQVEAEHRDHQRQAREEGDPPFAGDDEARALRDHDAPFR